MRFFIQLNILFFFIAVLPANVHAQGTKGSVEIDVDPGSGVFFSETGLPFDVPFRVRGSVTPALRRVTIKYRIQKDNFRSWMRFPNSTKGAWSSISKWDYTDEPSKDQKYRLKVGPLHPNVSYEFKLTIQKVPPVNDVQKGELKKTLFESVDAYLKDLNNLADGSIATLNAEINNKLQRAVGIGATIVNYDGTPFSADVMDGKLGDYTRKIVQHNVTRAGHILTLPGYANVLQSHPTFTSSNLILTSFLTTPANLSAAAKLIWEAPVAPNVTALKDLKFKELAAIVSNGAQQPKDILLGTAKIDQGSIVFSAVPDYPSMQVLLAFYTTLANGLITNTTPADPFSGINFHANIIAGINGAMDIQKAIKALEEEKAVLLANFPDLLADKLVSLSFIFVDRSVSDVVSQSTPYIGLDFGLTYIPNYSQLFLYEGVNIYFVPVNKDAPLSEFKGFWNNLSKRLSVHLGLTQLLIKAENKNYEPLVSNVGSLLLGSGLRVTRIVRLNYNTIFFYEKNPNPLITKKDFKAMGGFSITFDINIAKALGGFGKRLSLTTPN